MWSEELGKPNFCLYYQDWKNNIRQLKYTDKKGWHEQSFCLGLTTMALGPENQPFKALGCTSIAATAGTSSPWIFTLDNERRAQAWSSLPRSTVSISTNFIISHTFDRNTKLSNLYLDTVNGVLELYCGDGNKVIQKILDNTGKWKGENVLPNPGGMVTSTFVALGWALDLDNTAAEVHLFSLKGGKVRDYVVGAPKSVSFSLTRTGYVESSSDEGEEY